MRSAVKSITPTTWPFATNQSTEKDLGPPALNYRHIGGKMYFASTNFLFASALTTTAFVMTLISQPSLSLSFSGNSHKFSSAVLLSMCRATLLQPSR